MQAAVRPHSQTSPALLLLPLHARPTLWDNSADFRVASLWSRSLHRSPVLFSALCGMLPSHVRSSWRSMFHRSNKSVLALGSIVVLQFLLTLLYLSSIERERHWGKDGLPISSAIVANTRPIATECVCPSNETSDRCAAAVADAIATLERIKVEMHSPASGPVSAPAKSSDVATPVSSVVPSSSLKPLLLIAIPSMPRAADYLTGVLGALDRQLAKDPLDPLFLRTEIWVMNNAAAGVEHPAFEANRLIYANRPEFRFLRNDHALTDPNPLVQLVGADVPSSKVRKQTRDIVRLMQVASEASQYYLAMEDDFEICAHGLRIVEHLLRKAHWEGQSPTTPTTSTPAAAAAAADASARWITIKMGYGFNGLLLHNDLDLQIFAAYLLEHQSRRPPDHLNTEWSCAEKPQAKAFVGDRPHLTYRYNIFQHMGTSVATAARGSARSQRSAAGFHTLCACFVLITGFFALLPVCGSLLCVRAQNVQPPSRRQPWLPFLFPRDEFGRGVRCRCVRFQRMCT